MANAWVVASSSLFFVPAFLAFFRQNIVVAIIFFNAALFSTLYHLNDETEYEDLDVLWASLAVLISLVLLAVLARHYPPWHLRILVPFFLGVAGFIVYFVGGQMSSDPAVTEDDHYDLYHSLWHLFIGLAGAAVAWTPVNLAEANFTYGELYLDIARKYSHSPVNLKTTVL